MPQSPDDLDPVVVARNGYFDRFADVVGRRLVRTIVELAMRPTEGGFVPFTLEDESEAYALTANPTGLAFVLGLEGAVESISYEEALTRLPTDDPETD